VLREGTRRHFLAATGVPSTRRKVAVARLRALALGREHAKRGIIATHATSWGHPRPGQGKWVRAEANLSQYSLHFAGETRLRCKLAVRWCAGSQCLLPRKQVQPTTLAKKRTYGSRSQFGPHCHDPLFERDSGGSPTPLRERVMLSMSRTLPRLEGTVA
jgi:hypothetical protein